MRMLSNSILCLLRDVTLRYITLYYILYYIIYFHLYEYLCEGLDTLLSFSKMNMHEVLE